MFEVSCPEVMTVLSISVMVGHWLLVRKNRLRLDFGYLDRKHCDQDSNQDVMSSEVKIQSDNFCFIGSP